MKEREKLKKMHNGQKKKEMRERKRKREREKRIIVAVVREKGTKENM